MTTDVLFVAGEQLAASLAPALRTSHSVTVTFTPERGLEYLRRFRPAVVVIDMEVSNGTTAEICREAKSAATPATVIVTADAAEDVPDALSAGCDAVLLKPFAPNLFYVRLARLLRSRGEGPGASTTNRVWPQMPCPRCRHEGATGFEFTTRRRAWYACLNCRHVWLGKRLE
jgi:DNA-binding response OmpR family regulator